jgi:hypothetical protein
LATGELMRQALGLVRVQPDQLQQLGDRLATITPGYDVGVDLLRFTNDRADGHPWIQRRVRVLVHQLDVATRTPQTPAAHGVQRLAEQLDLACARPFQTGQQLCQRRLPRTRFAHDPERLAAVQFEIDPVDRVDSSPAAGEQASDPEGTPYIGGSQYDVHPAPPAKWQAA